MIGWIVLGLALAGGLIIFLNRDKPGDGAEARMSGALVSLFGMILVGIAVLTVLGAGLYNLF